MFAQSLAGRIVWTIAVASLPLFIVLIGYHRWRRICPLSFFARLPAQLGRPGTRRAPARLEANYYYIAFGIFVTSLWLRLIATNGDGRAIAVFFVALTLAALVVGARFTGKTWCNYICPVSFVEKIYTEPHGLRETSNSQCAKCTACKKSCPDINQENGYWKEIDSGPKRFVYFAFPGVVFAFYLYYLLLAGTFDYYFDGGWTNQPGVIGFAFLPGASAETAGFAFWPAIPRAVAALVTLVAGGGFSLFVFGQVERLVGRVVRRGNSATDASRIRHLTFALAAFTAFVTFYTFAGAPTLRRIPWAPQIFVVVVITTATFALIRRINRTQQLFADETVARNVLKRWEWSDVEPPADMHEALLLHTIRSREVGAWLRATAGDLWGCRARHARRRLRHPRRRRAPRIVARPPRDHEARPRNDHGGAGRGRAWPACRSDQAALGREAAATRNLPRGARAHTPDRDRPGARRRARAPARGIRRDGGGPPCATASWVARRRLPRASKRSSTRALGRRSSSRRSTPRHRQPTRSLARLCVPARRGVPSASSGCSRSSLTSAERQRIAESFTSGDRSTRDAAIARLRAAGGKTVVPSLQPEDGPARALDERLRAATLDPNPYIRAVALHALGLRGSADEPTLRRLSEDEHDLVRETAGDVTWRPDRGRDTAPEPPLTTVEKILALHAVPVFTSLAAEHLVELARAAGEVRYAPGEVLCVEGAPGDEIFVLLGGEAEVLRRGVGGDRVINREVTGSVIGEMAVLDPAPRSATVRAGAGGARALRLEGVAFRAALRADPAVGEGVILSLARRLRTVMGR